jgi:hypothetical protein
VNSTSPTSWLSSRPKIPIRNNTKCARYGNYADPSVSLLAGLLWLIFSQ